MSDAIQAALVKELGKLARQEENYAATQASVEILGDNPRERGKLQRQAEAIKETKENIKKFQAALGKK